MIDGRDSHCGPYQGDRLVDSRHLLGIDEHDAERTRKAVQVVKPFLIWGGSLHGGAAQPDRLREVSHVAGLLEPEPQRVAEVGQVSGTTGIACRACLQGFGDGLDCLVQVGNLPGSPEPSLQSRTEVGQVEPALRLAGGCGGQGTAQ